MAATTSSIQVLGTDKILRLNDYTLLGLVQSEDWQPDFNPQDIMELGNNTRVDTSYDLETNGTLTMKASGNTAGLLARMKVQRTSGAFTGYEYAPGTSKNAYSFTQSDLAEMQFDICMHEKPDQVNFSRSVWIPRCFLSEFSGSAEAGGDQTETFTWKGQFGLGFKTPYHDIRSVPATVTTALTLTAIDATVIPANYTLIYVMVDDKIFATTTGDATHAALGALGVVTLTTSVGYAIPATAVCRILVCKTVPSTTFPVLSGSDRGTTANYIKGYSANIFLAPASATSPALSDQWLRVQKCDWKTNLRLEDLKQIAVNPQGTSTYGRPPTFPLDLELNAEVTEADWADWQQIMTNAHDGTSPYADLFSWNPNLIKPSFAIVVQSFTKDGGTMLQQTAFTDMRINGAPEKTNVGGRGMFSWGFKGTAFTLQGFTG